MTFEKLNGQLTGRCSDRRKLANNTYAERRGESIAIRLHNTDIMLFHPHGAVSLYTGGWKTVTTRARINDYLPNPWRVWSDKGVWYLSDGTQRYPYADGMILADGLVTGAGDEPANLTSLKRKVKRYVDGYMQAFDAGEVKPPSQGDCWGCLMKAADGSTPMGGADHILSHIEEKYYVPSLLMRSIERFAVSQAALAYLSDKWAGTDNGSWYAEIGKEQISKSIRRWIYTELGMQG